MDVESRLFGVPVDRSLDFAILALRLRDACLATKSGHEQFRHEEIIYVCVRVFHKSHGLVSHVSDHHPHLLKKLQEDLSI